MVNLVCIGVCYLDTILSVPHYPEEDSKLRAASLTIRRGGNCPNTLEVLQQLLKAGTSHDVTPYLITCLPSATSSATEKIKRSFGPDSSVDMSRCIYRKGHSEAASSYIIRSEATGSRTIVNYNDLPELTAEEFIEAVHGMDGETWWHFEGRIPETTLACIEHLRKAFPKARVSVEIEKPGRLGLEELAARSDVVFYSKAWAENKGYGSAQACLNAQSSVACRASLLVCTWGSEGASLLSLPKEQCVSYQAGQTVRVIDTIGAGDTFVAGVLFGLLCHKDDWGPEKLIAFAVQLATQKVQQEGFDGVGAAAIALAK